jgi:O-6-methylguanine DNA methyltransferase
MKCCDVEALWDEMREGIEPRREHVLAHLRGCPPCQDMYSQYEGIAYCLTCLPIVEPPQSMVPRILEHIRESVARKLPPPDNIAKLESPIGVLHVAFRNTGITYIGLNRGEDDEELLARVSRRLHRGLVPSSAPQWVTDVVARFFRTHTVEADKIDISDLTPFEQLALRKAHEIPPGEVRSYGWIAKEIGHPHAARAVGQTMARNPVALLFPCHRVVDSAGDLHNYAYGIEIKARLLEMEGYRRPATRATLQTTLTKIQ